MSTTTHYFEVKVTGCKDCPYADADVKRCIAFSNHQLGVDVYAENKAQLTDSCPMWNETKESETK